MRSALIILAVTYACAAQEVRFSGSVETGERFDRDIGRGLVFSLEPQTDAGGEPLGWERSIHPTGSRENFFRCLNPPFHGPSAFDLDGALFREFQDAAAARNEVRKWKHPLEFTLNFSDHDGACRELDNILYKQPTKDPVTGGLVLGSPDYMSPPLGQAEFRITDIRFKSFVRGTDPVISFVKFKVLVRFPPAVRYPPSAVR